MNKYIKTVIILHRNRVVCKTTSIPIKNKTSIINITNYSQEQLANLNKLQVQNKHIQLTFTNEDSNISYANALQFKTFTLGNLKNILLNADINQIYSVSKIEYKYDK